MRSLAALIGCVVLVATAEAKQPNFIVFFADDLGYGDLGSYGHPYIRTPNLDALAAAGQRWTDFYVAASVCSPSRAALLTGRLPVRSGQYGDQIGVYFPDEEGGLPEQEVTLPEVLKQVGYRTAIFGKWHLGDAPHAWPTRHGFDVWEGLPYSNDMDWVDEPDLDELIALRAAGKTEVLAESSARRAALYAEPIPGRWNVPYLASKNLGAGAFDDQTLEQPADQPQLTRRATKAAMDFIVTPDERPFFLYIPYSMPHTPLFASAEFAGKSLGGRYGDIVEELDWSVGEIVRTLLAANKIDNTLVIFTSDNGPWLSMQIEGGRAGLLNNGKGTTFEGGMRVPAIFWWPGKVHRGTVSEMGSTLDLFATISALAGSDAVAEDSVDLASTLFTGAASPRSEMPFYRGSTLYAYRYGDWKLHFITEGRYGLPPERTEHAAPLLFNLKRDPSERFDVASDHPAIVAEILAAIERHRDGLEVQPPAMDARLARLGNAP